MMVTSLDKCKPSQFCQLEDIQLAHKKVSRLQELGMLPGEQIQCVYTAPGGSPIAFRMKGALIALRAVDCRKISVTLHA